MKAKILADFQICVSVPLTCCLGTCNNIGFFLVKQVNEVIIKMATKTIPKTNCIRKKRYQHKNNPTLQLGVNLLVRL